MKIFSRLPHELSGDFLVDENDPNGAREEWLIHPGNNDLPDELAKRVLALPGIARRVGRGWLRPGYVGNQQDHMFLIQPVDRRLITDLSVKAKPMADDQMYDSKRRYRDGDILANKTIAKLNSLIERGEKMLARSTDLQVGVPAEG